MKVVDVKYCRRRNFGNGISSVVRVDSNYCDGKNDKSLKCSNNVQMLTYHLLDLLWFQIECHYQ